MKPPLKICGLMRRRDVSLCCDLGVDSCGFVVEYPVAVPWNLTREQCAPLLKDVRSPAKRCIVTGGDRDKIISLANALNPDFIQLHYKETLEDTRYIISKLEGRQIRVIKTIPLSPAERREQFGTSDVASCARALCDAGAAMILMDPRGASTAAEKSSQADFLLFRTAKQAASCPVMLGGGITADNCIAVLKAAGPDVLDIMSGVEQSPGRKSKEKLETLIDLLSHKTMDQTSS